MANIDLEYLSEQFEREMSEEDSPSALRFKPRKRPEYCKKRPPVRKGIACRSNYRSARL